MMPERHAVFVCALGTCAASLCACTVAPPAMGAALVGLGVICTIAAVLYFRDAHVLEVERLREEQERWGRIASEYVERQQRELDEARAQVADHINTATPETRAAAHRLHVERWNRRLTE